jgi:hypothetical protein
VVEAAVAEDASEAILLMTRTPSGTAKEFRVDGGLIGVVRLSEGRWTLELDSTRISVGKSEQPLSPDGPYPRKIVVDGRWEGGGPAIRQAYTLLAPPAPLRVEGLGLQVSTDEPGINEDEHRELRDWLEAQGLAGDIEDFERLHCAESGRELRVWYEISGRRVHGTLTRARSGQPAARFDSLFHTAGEGWKIHHKRTGERGKFSYHRASLELVDTLLDLTRDEGTRELRAYHCGCYGYGIAADWATLGDSYLYQVEADWLDDRVAIGFFVGWEWRDTFPWIGIGDRKRVRTLARRVQAFRLKDAQQRLFAEVAIDLPSDPPPTRLGPADYRVQLAGLDGTIEPLARIAYTPGEIAVHLMISDDAGVDEGGRPGWWPALERLDALLAAMPTQVVRGDGVRDSHLGEIENMLDWIRLIREPSEAHLADVVSEIDALTAVSKVHALLEADAPRFTAEAAAFPPPPRRHSGAPEDPACVEKVAEPASVGGAL